MNWDYVPKNYWVFKWRVYNFELMPIGNLKLRVIQKTLRVTRAILRFWRCTQVAVQHPTGHRVCLPNTAGRMQSQPCSQGTAVETLGTPWHGPWSPHGMWQWQWCCSYRQLWGQAGNIYRHPGPGRKTCDSLHDDDIKDMDLWCM